MKLQDCIILGSTFVLMPPLEENWSRRGLERRVPVRRDPKVSFRTLRSRELFVIRVGTKIPCRF